MSDAELARAIRAQMRRARALQEHINLLGAGLPDPCADLLAAARAVVDSVQGLLDCDNACGQCWHVPSILLDALRAAVEANEVH